MVDYGQLNDKTVDAVKKVGDQHAQRHGTEMKKISGTVTKIIKRRDSYEYDQNYSVYQMNQIIVNDTFYVQIENRKKYVTQ